MSKLFKSVSSRLLFAPAMMLVAALVAGPAWSQEKAEKKPTDAKTPATESKDSTKDAAKDAKETAKDTAKDAKQAAKDTAKDAKDSAKDTAKSAKDSAKDVSKSTKDSAKDAARQTDRAKETGRYQRDVTNRAQDSARDTARDVRAPARDADRSTRDVRDRQDDDLPDDRDIRDRRDARDLRDTRDARDRDLPDDRDIRDDRDLRDRRDVRDTRDIDRRDVRTDVRSRTDLRNRADTRVSRTRIDNFRADSVTARDLGVTFGRATDRGLVIQDLSRNAVLADFGLRTGDVIVSVADHPVATEREFFRWMFAQDLRHERITLVVLRDGREVPIYVRPVTVIEELVMIQDEFDPLHHFGVVIDDRRPREIVVVRVLPGSPAFRAGIREGDVITTFRGQRLLGPQQFVQVLESVQPGEIPILVNRNRQIEELQVTLPRMERRTVARPDLDVDAPAIERREERRENRIERREERRDGVPGVQPVPPTTTRPGRPAILPRNR